MKSAPAIAFDYRPSRAVAAATLAIVVLAALAPWAVARLHEASGGFQAGWIMHLGSVALVTLLVAQLAPQRYAQAMRAP